MISGIKGAGKSSIDEWAKQCHRQLFANLEL